MNNAIKPKDIYGIISKDYCFIDIRDHFQFEQLHVKNFKNVPYDNIFQFSFPLHQPIILICYSGEKAKRLAHHLSQLGYHAYYIEGGFQALLNLHNNQYF